MATIAIIIAGGAGSRMGRDFPKHFIDVLARVDAVVFPERPAKRTAK